MYAPKQYYRSPVVKQDAQVAVGEVALPLNGLVKVDATGFEFVHDGRPAEEMQQVIFAVTKNLLAAQGSHNEYPVQHELVDGMYIRRLFIPKGQILVGKVHKLPCINVVERGDIAILTATGSKRVTAGYTLASPAGIQKLGIANEDTVFINIFRTDETDISKIEDVVAWDIHESLGESLCQLQQ